MALTEQEKTQAIKDALDPNKIYIYCGQHNYYGPNRKNPSLAPTKNCPKCWEVYFWHDMATTPPEMRDQRLSELEEVIHKVVEMVEAGTWDFVPYRHPKIEISSE